MFRIFDSVWKRINRSYNVSLIACATRTVQQSAHTANKHSPPAVAAVENMPQHTNGATRLASQGHSILVRHAKCLL